MYHNIINFLLGRTKKNLSKQEADDLMKLIAQSIGLEEEYKEKTDDKSFIKRMLDEVIIEENTGEEEFCGALDDIFDFEEDSYEYAEDYEDQEEMFEGIQPLSKRKISRKNVFRRVEGDLENVKKDLISKNNENDNIDKINMNNSNDNKSNMNNGNEIVNPSIVSNINTKDKEIDTFTQQSASNIPSEFNLPNLSNITNAFETKLDNSEFTFEIEPLESVNNTGPQFKFLDENGKDF